MPEDRNLLDRIIVDPGILVGKPVIRGTRLSVQYVLGLLAAGARPDEILAEYEALTADDIQACLLFAAQALENCAFIPLQAKPA